ncbi:hypothetical protein BH11MYX1_BH11MYX1_31160 [soil metagenome]
MIRAMRGEVLGVILACVLGACGPVAYIGQVTIKADDAVEAARQAEADKYSPYWWTRATQYLQMARDVAGHADFQGANHFGRLAAEAAEQAKAEADAAPKTGPAPGRGGTTDRTAPVAPAKADSP